MVGGFGKGRQDRTMQRFGSSSELLTASAEHAQFCFDVLSAHLSGDSGPSATFDDSFW